MKWWDRMLWSYFSECWVLSQLFHSPFTFIKRLFSSFSLSAIRVVSSASEVIDISPSNLDSSFCFIQPGISHDILCIYKLSKQGDSIQSWCTPFPVLNQSIVPCPVLTVLPDLRTYFSRGRSGGLVFPCLEEFSQFVVIHTVKGFGIVNKTEADVLFCFVSWNSLAFLMIHRMLAIWSLVPLPFLNPAWTSGSSWFMYCWSLAWRILSITLLVCEMSAIVQQFEHSWMKTDIFQSCGHCWDFQICWHIECSTFSASSFRIWNSSTGIPSPPLALFVVMLPKARLTSHSRMSGSSLMMTPHGYLGHEDLFLYSSVYSCHLFLISSASVRSLVAQR